MITRQNRVYCIYYGNKSRNPEMTGFQWRYSSGPLQYSLVIPDLTNEILDAGFFFFSFFFPQKPLVAHPRIPPVVLGARRTMAMSTRGHQQ
jgi:hypothetical protein